MKGTLCAFLSGPLYGIVPILILSVTRVEAITNTMCLFWRMLFAAVLLLPFSISRIRKEKPDWDMIRKTIVSSILMSGTSLLLYSSYSWIPSGIGTTIHYTYPLFVLCISVVFFKTKINHQTVFAMLLSLFGIVVLCDVSVLADRAALGIALALLSAVMFSLYFLWTEHQRLDQYDPIVYLLMQCVFASVFIGLANAGMGRFTLQMTPHSYGILVIVGFVAVLGFFTQFVGLTIAGSVRTAIFETLEPIVCTIGSAFVLHDSLSIRALVGCVMVIISVIIMTLGRAQAGK